MTKQAEDKQVLSEICPLQTRLSFSKQEEHQKKIVDQE